MCLGASGALLLVETLTSRLSRNSPGCGGVLGSVPPADGPDVDTFLDMASDLKNEEDSFV